MGRRSTSRLARGVWLSIVVLTGCTTTVRWERGLGEVEWADVGVRDVFGGTDRWEVAVCRVPDGVSDPLYVTSAERMSIGVDEVVERLEGVTQYFERWSHDRYRIEWIEAPEVSIDEDESAVDCVDRALDQSASSTNGVLVVADVQHDVDEPGGWGRRGERCDRPCAASLSRRAAYVGASDFTSYWGDRSPLDLVEHEIGHALGWPHSASAAGVGDNHVYDSDLDVMSDSAAPRLVDPERRHAPGVLAFDAWASGWLDDSEVAFFSLERLRSGDWQDAVRLVASDTPPPSDGGLHVRLIVVELDEDLLTIELLADRGDFDHLASPGVAVHRLVFDDDAPENRWHVVELIGADGSLVLGANSSWKSPEVSIRTGSIDDVSTATSIDVRIKREVS